MGYFHDLVNARWRALREESIRGRFPKDNHKHN